MLPRVSRWSLLNEPNQPGWLTPQYERKKRRLVATAAVVYRALATAGIKGLRASGHGRDQILLGETAPIGRTSGSLARRPIPPVEFLRKLFCLNPSGRRLRGADGRAHGCRKFKRLAVKGFAHHPYQRGGSRPPAEPPQAAGEITISSPSRLRRVLDQAARARRIPRRLPVFYTEFGFQTNPPDRIFGVRVALQAGYINQSDWMAYRDRRVRAVAQYKLIDEASLSSFQSGLRFLDGRAEARLRRLPAADLGQRPRLAAAGLRAGAHGRGLDAAGRPDPEPAAQRRALHDGHHADGALAQGPLPDARAEARRRVAAAGERADFARGAGRTPMT